jgi:hypothetical protein
MLEGKVDDIQSYINDIVQTSDQRVAKVQTEMNTLKTNQGTKLDTLNTKLDALELELETINGLALFDKLADLSTEVHSLESQGKLDNDIRGRLASLETEVEQLIDALPASRKASDIEPFIDELMEKNSFMESVIKHQTNVLRAQNKQIQAIEAKLAQLQMPGQLPGQQKVVEHVADQVEVQILSKSSSGGGIRIVPRKERVKPQEYFFMKWLRGDAEATDLCYPHSVIEKKEH